MTPRFHVSPGFVATRALLSAGSHRGASEPLVIDGQTLDPAARVMCQVAEAVSPFGRPGWGPDLRRRNMRLSAGLAMATLRGVQTEDRHIPGPERPLRIRIFRPHSGGVRPGIVYLHGGGWVLGDLDTHDGLCRVLAQFADAVVVSIDYRRPPEHPFPAPLLDAEAGYHWTLAHAADLAVDPGRVAVAGDSAGGNLAAVLARRLRDASARPPLVQALLYPSTDLRLSSRSLDLFGERLLLTRADVEWFADQYVPDRDTRLLPDASPLLAEDLSGLPPALVWTAGFDPLRDEGESYAERLAAAGNRVWSHRESGMIHGYLSMAVLPAGMTMIAEMCRRVAVWLHA